MKKQFLLLISFIFILTIPLNADLEYTIPEDPNKPLLTVLENGLQVAIKHVPASKMISCQLWVRAGSLTEGDYIGSGISHYLEHLLFKGTEKRRVGEIAQEIERKGGYINAYTSFDRTVYTIDLPSDYLDTGLDILADVSVNATLDLVEFEKEKKVILQELSFSNDNPEKKVSRLLWSNAFRTHPYHHPVIGYKSVFEKVTREEVEEYYKRLYVPNNMLLVVAGNVNPEQTIEKVEDYFSSLERGSVAPFSLPVEPPQIGPRQLVVEKELNKAFFYLAFHGPSLTSPDVGPLDVLAAILGQGKGSRLYKSIREEKQLAYSVEAWSYTPKEPGLFALSATLAPENIEPLKEALWEEIKKVQTEGVTSVELQKAKATILRDMLSSLETAKGQASSLGSNLFTAEDADYTRTYLNQVMAATPEEVQAMASKYLSKEKEILTVLKPKTKSAKKETAVVVAAESVEVVKTILPNGMTLLTRSIPGLPFVSIKAVFKGGVLIESSDKNGVTYLMSQLFSKGTQNRSRQEYMNQLELYGGEVTSYAGYNSFGSQMTLLSPFWKEGIQLMQEMIQSPNFNQQDLEREKKVMQAGIRAREDDPFDAAGKLLRESLFVQHPYRLQAQGKIESVSQLTLNDVQQLYSTYVDPENMVFVVVGGIEDQQVKDYVSTLFASFKSKQKIKFPNPKQQVQKEIRRQIKEKESAQAVLALGFHTVDLYNPDQYALEIIASIYSGQGSRLFKSVREERGLAYTVGAYQVMGLDPGFFTFYAGTRPDKGDEVVDIILQELALLKESGITQEELERAQNGLIGSRQKRMESSSTFAFKIALDELYGLGMESYNNYEKNIRGVTLNDITRVARKYFNEKEYSLIIVKPNQDSL